MSAFCPHLVVTSLQSSTKIPASNLSRCADDYPCLPGTAPDARFCPIKEVPFRGVNCSDAAGGEIGYQSIQAMVDSNGTITGRMCAPELLNVGVSIS